MTMEMKMMRQFSQFVESSKCPCNLPEACQIPRAWQYSWWTQYEAVGSLKQNQYTFSANALTESEADTESKQRSTCVCVCVCVRVCVCVCVCV